MPLFPYDVAYLPFSAVIPDFTMTFLLGGNLFTSLDTSICMKGPNANQSKVFYDISDCQITHVSGSALSCGSDNDINARGKMAVSFRGNPLTCFPFSNSDSTNLIALNLRDTFIREIPCSLKSTFLILRYLSIGVDGILDKRKAVDCCQLLYVSQHEGIECFVDIEASFDEQYDSIFHRSMPSLDSSRSSTICLSPHADGESQWNYYSLFVTEGRDKKCTQEEMCASNFCTIARSNVSDQYFIVFSIGLSFVCAYILATLFCMTRKNSLARFEEIAWKFPKPREEKVIFSCPSRAPDCNAAPLHGSPAAINSCPPSIHVNYGTFRKHFYFIDTCCENDVPLPTALSPSSGPDQEYYTYPTDCVFTAPKDTSLVYSDELSDPYYKIVYSFQK